MALILGIETATEVCSVSLSLNGLCLAENSIQSGNMHASMLHILVDKILSQTEKTLKDLQAVAISMGPGSYTGLRVGTASAKGYCFALNIPLIAINSLESLSKCVLDQTDIKKNSLLLPMIDARRMEVYTAAFDTELNEVEKTQAVILDEAYVKHITQNHEVIYFGNGSDKAIELFGSYQAKHIADVQLNAKGLCKIAYTKFKLQQFEDLRSFEPFYLKDFIGTQPKSRL